MGTDWTIKCKVGPIFKGLAPIDSRRAVKTYVRQHMGGFKSFMVPCVGIFALPEIFIELGAKPETIHTSDISLFSSTLGYCFDPAKSIDDLCFEVLDKKLIKAAINFPLETNEHKAAFILYVLKYCQLNSKSVYVQNQRREMLFNPMIVFERYLSGINKLKQTLYGCHYKIEDAYLDLHDHWDNPECFIWFNPPGYAGGYEKMYDSRGFYTWDEPTLPNLLLSEVPAIHELMRDKPATIACLSEDWYELPLMEDKGWYKYHVTTVGTNVYTEKRVFVMLNKDPKGSLFSRSNIKEIPKNIPPVFDDHEITKDSKISVVECYKDMAWYFYDMFAKELGAIESVDYYLFCVDGQIVGTLGFFTKDIILNRVSSLFESFGITIISKKYKRLNRLLMRYITSQLFIDQFERECIPANLFMPKITSLRTTCIAKYPEVKANRGILKLKDRTQLPNGRYHIRYEGDIHKMTHDEILNEWLTKHSKY